MLQAGTMSHAEDSQVHQDGGDALPAILRPGIDTVVEEVCITAGTQLRSAGSQYVNGNTELLQVT